MPLAGSHKLLLYFRREYTVSSISTVVPTEATNHDKITHDIKCAYFSNVGVKVGARGLTPSHLQFLFAKVQRSVFFTPATNEQECR